MKKKYLQIVLVSTLGVALVGSRINSTPGLPLGKVDSIVFLDSKHGFIQVAATPHSKEYESRDGGKTWKQITEGVPGFRRGRFFATKWTGWSINEGLWPNGEVYKTEDGGKTWKLSLKAANKYEFVFGGLQAISSTEVWVAGLTTAYHTSDGGTTWEHGGPAGTGLQFLDTKRGWIEAEKLWHTENGGKTWEAVGKDGKSCFGGLGFYFLDDEHGWGVSGKTEGNIEGGAQTGYVVATSDGGKTCSSIAEIPGHFLWSVFYLNEREGWAGGIGSILRTEDGGHTWVNVSD
jgi:photosystem II stability/assembly factor-like uncharacterized protein